MEKYRVSARKYLTVASLLPGRLWITDGSHMDPVLEGKVNAGLKYLTELRKQLEAKEATAMVQVVDRFSGLVSEMKQALVDRQTAALKALQELTVRYSQLQQKYDAVTARLAFQQDGDVLAGLGDGLIAAIGDDNAEPSVSRDGEPQSGPASDPNPASDPVG